MSEEPKISRKKFITAATAVVGTAVTGVLLLNRSSTVAPLPSLSSAVFPFFSVHIVKQGSNFLISWTGGSPPYQLWRCGAVGTPWVKAGVPTMKVSSVVPNTDGIAMFRVQHAVPLLHVQGNFLVWSAPEL